MKIALLVLFFAAITAPPCSAQIRDDTIDQLRRGHPEAAERVFSSLQQSFARGQATEYDLIDSYKHFGDEDAALASALDRWIDIFPKSSSAHLARGIYYRKRGEARRGTRYVGKTPTADLQYMMRMFSKAKPDLLKAAQLDNRSYLAELSLLNIATYEGDTAGANHAFLNATRILPSAVLARTRYAVMLTPRWGGTYDQLDAFISRCRSQGVSNGTLNLLRAIKLEEQGLDAEESGHLNRARLLYQQALPLSRSGGPRFRSVYLYNSLRFCRHFKYGGADCS